MQSSQLVERECKFDLDWQKGKAQIWHQLEIFPNEDTSKEWPYF